MPLDATADDTWEKKSKARREGPLQKSTPADGVHVSGCSSSHGVKIRRPAITYNNNPRNRKTDLLRSGLSSCCRGSHISVLALLSKALLPDSNRRLKAVYTIGVQVADLNKHDCCKPGPQQLGSTTSSVC